MALAPGVRLGSYEVTANIGDAPRPWERSVVK